MIPRSGIYRITCRATGAFYIGSSVSIVKRWSLHRLYLRRGAHANSILQRNWAKYGEAAFAFEVLEACDRDELLAREQHYIDALGATCRPDGMNICLTSKSALGVKRRPETLARMSAAQTPEKRAALAERNRRRHPSHIAKTAESNRARVWTDDARERLRVANKAQFESEEARAAHGELIRAAMASPEVRAKISAAAKLRPPHAPSNKGRALTTEEKANVAAGVRRSWTDERRAAQADRMRGNHLRRDAK